MIIHKAGDFFLPLRYVRSGEAIKMQMAVGSLNNKSLTFPYDEKVFGKPPMLSLERNIDHLSTGKAVILCERERGEALATIVYKYFNRD
jgi:predicted patatin/cPLA2 family phospholipase